MSFDYAFACEDRAVFHTSRWLLTGVSTRADGNITDGRLWMTAERSGDVVTVELYKDPHLSAGSKVAAGTADVSGIDLEPARCALAEANGSGLGGELYFESYAADDTDGVEVLVSLAMDADLAMEYAGLSGLPAWDAATGMAAFCAEATRRVLLLAAQLFRERLGGCGAPEHRYHRRASRAWPDYRRLANPDQLRPAAVHWALMLAFRRSHDMAEETMYSQRADHHDRKRSEAIESWNLAFDTDADGRADQGGSAAVRRVTRV
jgi:hypothetical protein